MSVITALCWVPVPDTVFMGFPLFPNDNVNAEKARAFFEQLEIEPCVPLTVVWDDLSVHIQALQGREDLFRSFLNHSPFFSGN